LRGVALLIVLGLVGACGGGGGGPVVPPDDGGQSEPEIGNGLSGVLRLRDVHLGLVAEQEPNNGGAVQRLAPVWAGTTLEVVGTLGSTAEQFGTVDPLDRLRFTCLAGQQINLTLEGRELGGSTSGLRVEVHAQGGIDPLATTSPGTFPLTTTFNAAANTEYDLVVALDGGHALWRLVIEARGPVAPLRQARTLRAPSRPVLPPVPAFEGCAPGRVLVRFEPGADRAAICEAHGIRLERELSSGTCRLAFDCPQDARGEQMAVARAAALRDVAGVAFAEPDYLVKPLADVTDTEFPRQWNLRAVGAPAAWDVTRGDPSVVIGFIDSGVIPHPDLAGKLVPGHDFIDTFSLAADGDGRDSDPTDPGDGFLGEGLSSWHGTHMSAIAVGAQNDDYGISGIAPDCRVMHLRALGRGGGFVSDVVAALDYGAGLGPDPAGNTRSEPLPIMNMSLGLVEDSAELRDACDRANNRGVLLVAASGNSGGAVLFPAAYDSVVAVAAVNAELETTSYSNSGSKVELSAPGGILVRDAAGDGWPDGVLSAVYDETVFPPAFSHRALIGTSQSAPHVSAVAALMLSLDPSLTNTELRELLRSTALDVGTPGRDDANGDGLVQASKAVNAVLERLGTPRSDPPVLQLGMRSVRFVGFESRVVIPVQNAGGGRLQIIASPSITEDLGVPWLSASLRQPVPARPDTTIDALEITVDRSGLPDGRYWGVIRLSGISDVLTVIPVVMYVGTFPHVGRPLQVVAIDDVTGIPGRSMTATPDFGWRYLLTNFTAGTYILKAGEDLDEDNTYCEPSDACGYYGGPDAGSALPVFYDPANPPTLGLDVFLTGP
jgi:serine protease